jgi:3-oxoacid CoA-transferase subunit A
VELTPEARWPSGCGRRLEIPAFYTATGVGTQVADGGLPWRYDGEGNVLISLISQGDQDLPHR